MSDVNDLEPNYQAVKRGRGQSSCRHLQLSGSLEWPKAVNTNAQHSAEEISAFHQRDGSSWKACDKRLLLSHQWFSRAGGNGASWLHAFTIYISFPALYFPQKVIFPRLWKEDNVGFFFFLFLKRKYCIHMLNAPILKSLICGCSRGELPANAADSSRYVAEFYSIIF